MLSDLEINAFYYSLSCASSISFLPLSSSLTVFLLHWPLAVLHIHQVRDQFKDLGSCQVLQIRYSSRYTQLHPFQLFNHLSVYLHFSFFSIGDFLPSPSVFCDINVVSYTLENVSILVQMFCITRLKLCISMLCHQKSALPFSSPLHVLHVFPMSEYDAILILHGSSLELG